MFSHHKMDSYKLMSPPSSSSSKADNNDENQQGNGPNKVLFKPKITMQDVDAVRGYDPRVISKHTAKPWYVFDFNNYYYVSCNLFVSL
jgi:hypothetical protein